MATTALGSGVIGDTGNQSGKGCAMKLTIPIPSMSSLGGGGVGSSSSADGHRSAPKSPVTVQDWVNSIDLCDDKTEDYAESTAAAEVVAATEIEDNLGLGDEAHHWRTGEEGDGSHRMPALNEDGTRTSQSESGIQKRVGFLQSKNTHRSLQSELSALSNSTISSVETLLESRRDDPEQLLLGLGFGGGSDAELTERVPKRFLRRSMVKGNDIDEFLRRQQETWDALDVGSCGYLGLSGLRFDGCPPSGIVQQLLTKIRDNERKALERSPSEEGPTSHMRLLDVAFSVMAANTFRSVIRPNNTNGRKEESILAPENREFLEKQEQTGEEDGERRKRRVILGRDSFSVDVDGQLVHVGEVSEPLARRRLASLIVDDVAPHEDPVEIVPISVAVPATAAARRALRLRKQAQVVSCVDTEEVSSSPILQSPESPRLHKAAEHRVVRVDSAMSNSSGFLEGDQSTTSAAATRPFLRRGSRSLPDRLGQPDVDDSNRSMAMSSSALECPGECTVVRFCRNRLRSMRMACERLDEQIAQRVPDDPSVKRPVEHVLQDTGGGEGGVGGIGEDEVVEDIGCGPVAANTPLDVELRKMKNEIMAEMRQLLVAERRAVQEQLQEFQGNIATIRTGLSALLSILDRHWTVPHVE